MCDEWDNVISKTVSMHPFVICHWSFRFFVHKIRNQILGDISRYWSLRAQVGRKIQVGPTHLVVPMLNLPSAATLQIYWTNRLFIYFSSCAGAKQMYFVNVYRKCRTWKDDESWKREGIWISSSPVERMIQDCSLSEIVSSNLSFLIVDVGVSSKLCPHICAFWLHLDCCSASVLTRWNPQSKRHNGPNFLICLHHRTSKATCMLCQYCQKIYFGLVKVL